MFKLNALRYGALISLLLIVIVPQTLVANELTPLHQWTIDEEAFVIVNVKVNGRSVVSDLEAYYTQSNKLLLPISVLKSTMGINFSITEGSLTATVDSTKLALSTTLLAAQSVTPTASFWAKDDYDHYVDLSVINTLLETDSTFDYSLMQVSFMSNLLSTTNDKKNTSITHKQAIAPQYDHFIEDQYRLLTYPISEYTISSTATSKQARYKGLIRLNSYFDLFHHRAEVRFNKNENSDNTFFKISKDFSLTEQDHSLARIHYQLGDIQSQSDQLTTASSQGRGIYISNADPRSAQNFSSITIEEPALPGWQAELYRNGQFLATTQANDDNLVKFIDIETFYGNNIFEIKLFGPQGEQITRTQKYTIGQDALSPGKISYQVELIETDKSVFDNNQNTQNTFSDTFKASVSYGISENLTYDAQITQLASDERSRYISSGLNILTEHGSYRFLSSKQLNAGSAYYAGFRGLFSNDFYNDVNVNLEYTALDDFSSALFLPQNNVLKNKLSISLNGRSDSFDSLNWNMKWLNENRENKSNNNTFSLGINKNHIGGTWAGRLFYDEQEDELTNQLYSSIDIASWKWTNTLDWLPINGGKLVSLRSNLRWPQTQQTFNQTQLSYNPDSSATAQLSHQYTYRYDIFNVQVSGQYDSRGDWRVSLGLNGTFSFDHLELDMIFDTPRALSGGQLEASAFIDWNENRVFDQGDEALEDVRFTGNYLWRNKFTNNTGKALLPSSHGGQILEVDLRTLPNPYLQPVLGKIKTYAHRGGQTKVDVPMVIFNEVEGTVYFENNDKSKPVSGVTVFLKQINGDKEYTTTTEYDGYYYFSNVSQGNYKIEVEANTLNIKSLVTKNLPERVVTSKTGDTIILKDIVLQPKNNTIDSIELVDKPSEKSFFVQLGVFKKFESAVIVAKEIDSKAHPLKLYKHQTRNSYYLVTGPYANAQDAQTTINDVYSTPALHGSFMVDARRYTSTDWRLMHAWGEQKKNTQGLYFCQYAAYTSKKSIKPQLIKADFALFTINRNINGKKYFLLLSGPHIQQSQSACSTLTSRQINEGSTPIKKSWSDLYK